ncbi:MAG: NusG domain II-containing protein [Lachnospiraceae bacterium]|nr:NusG domain II-containing protein [Lachnospiraceae bacterium]
MKKRDFILIAVLLIIAGLSFGFIKLTAKSGNQVIVTIDNKEVATASLTKNQKITVPLKNEKNMISIRDGKVTMESADCPDQICVKHKPISKSGETIVCLPHKVVVEIIGEKESDVDMIAQ